MNYTRKIRRLKKRLWSKVETKKEDLFLSPVEAKVIEVLGGKVIKTNRIKHPVTGFPLTLVLSRGKLLRAEDFRRTNDRLILFSNSLKMGLAIRGAEYKRDIIGAWERDQKLEAEGWRIQYIDIEWLVNNPLRARQAVSQFIYS